MSFSTGAMKWVQVRSFEGIWKLMHHPNWKIPAIKSQARAGHSLHKLSLFTLLSFTGQIIVRCDLRIKTTM